MLRVLKLALLKRNSILQQVSFVVGGTVAAQLLNILTLPLLSRIYSPADFGVMAVYSSILAVLAQISGLRYYLAIPLPKQKRYAFALVAISFILQIFVVAILTIVVAVYGNSILTMCSMEALIPFKWFLPVGLFFIGIFNIVSQWAIRESLFSTLGKTKIVQSGAGVFIKILLGLYGLKPLGLIIGTVIGQGSGITTLLKRIYITEGIPGFSKSNLYRAFLKFRKFPMYSCMFGILNAIGMNMPQLFLSSYFSMEITGLFTMASALLHLPSVFIGEALGQIFIQRASVASYSGNLKETAYKTYIILLNIGVFPIIFISVFAPILFSIVLGPKWQAAGEYALLLAPWVAVAFAFSPLSMLYSIQDRQEVGLVTEVIYFVLRFASMYVGAIMTSPHIAVGLFSLSGTFLLFFRMVDILKTLGISIQRICRDAITISLKAILLTSLPYLLYFYNFNCSFIIASVIMIGLIYLYNLYKLLQANHIL